MMGHLVQECEELQTKLCLPWPLGQLAQRLTGPNLKEPNREKTSLLRVIQPGDGNPEKG